MFYGCSRGVAGLHCIYCRSRSFVLLSSRSDHRRAHELSWWRKQVEERQHELWCRDNNIDERPPQAGEAGCSCREPTLVKVPTPTRRLSQVGATFHDWNDGFPCTAVQGFCCSVRTCRPRPDDTQWAVTKNDDIGLVRLRSRGHIPSRAVGRPEAGRGGAERPRPPAHSDERSRGAAPQGSREGPTHAYAKDDSIFLASCHSWTVETCL